MSFEAQLTRIVRDAVEPMLTELEGRLAEKLRSTQPTQPAELLSQTEVARLLRVVPRTVQRMVARGELPAPIQLSPSCVRWRRADLDSWLEAR